MNTAKLFMLQCKRRWLAAPMIGVVAAGLLLAPAARGADPDAGLTGKSHPEDVIMARQLLMDGVEQAMMAVEVALGGREARIADLQAQAYTINILLSAFPHMFPPETAPVTSADGSSNGTTATPELWDNFDDFYDQAQAAATAAFDVSQAGDLPKMREAAARLRNGCDTCHAQYMHVPDPVAPR